MFCWIQQEALQSSNICLYIKGLITCNNCGCIASSELKMEQYIYYISTNAKHNCSRIYVREEDFLRQSMFTLEGFNTQIVLLKKSPTIYAQFTILNKSIIKSNSSLSIKSRIVFKRELAKCMMTS